jgi:voltage-gated potassium channel Kch
LASAADFLGLSREMGALIAGVALSTSPYSLAVTSKVTSLRDFFVTLFFVALGMRIPNPTWSLVGYALVASAFVIGSRFLTISPLLHVLRRGHRIAIIPAINLSQISEFSLVILVLGVRANHISQSTLDICAYAFVILAVGSTFAMARSEQLLNVTSSLLSRFGVPDLERDISTSEEGGKTARIFILGFHRTESALLEELTAKDPVLAKEIAILDFNPEVNEKLRYRKLRAIYGDISRRETLIHAGVHHAEILICALPDKILKGMSKSRLVQQLREINPTAKIIVTCESLEDVQALYAAGATCVSVPRFAQANELFGLLEAALNDSLDARRSELDALALSRSEVIP